MTEPLDPKPVPEGVFKYAKSIFPAMIADESELTAGVKIEPGRDYGFFTDSSLCIGCKACEVACKEWNTLPMDDFGLTGMSYDNTKALSASTWRHVAFVEKISNGRSENFSRPTALEPYQSNWLMLSDVCKHCRRAGCLEACPTGALFRTEFGSVVVQQDICNGCGYCVPSCPFGVVELSRTDGKAHKCTLCYDRLKGGLEPACAKSCPTNSIQFGEVGDLYERAQRRLAELRRLGRTDAHLYGTPGAQGATGGIESLHCCFLILDKPEVYNLPQAPELPMERIPESLKTGLGFWAGLALASGVLIAVSQWGKEPRQ